MTAKKRNILNHVLAALMVITTFSGFGLRPLYIFCGVSLMLLSLFALVKDWPEKNENKIYKIVATWSCYSIIVALFEHSADSLYTSLMHAGVLILFWGALHRTKDRSDRQYFVNLFKGIHYALLIFLVIVFLVSRDDLSNFETFIYIGLATLPSAIISEKKNRKIAIKVIALSIAWAIMSYIIGARAQVLSFIIFPITFALLSIKKIKRKTLDIAFVILFLVLNIFPLCYIDLSTNQIGNNLSEMSLALTSSRFFSGRDKLWSAAYDKIDTPSKLIFGIGINGTKQLINEKGMSLHNLYVTCLTEGGLVFVTLLGVALLLTWRKLGENNTLLAKLTMAMFITVLYKQSFDISLIENNICFAVAIWSAIAIGCNAKSKKPTK